MGYKGWNQGQPTDSVQSKHTLCTVLLLQSCYQSLSYTRYLHLLWELTVDFI